MIQGFAGRRGDYDRRRKRLNRRRGRDAGSLDARGLLDTRSFLRTRRTVVVAAAQALDRRACKIADTAVLFRSDRGLDRHGGVWR